MNDLTPEELEAIIIFVREGITVYGLPNYRRYAKKVIAAESALNKLTAQQKKYENTTPHNPA